MESLWGIRRAEGLSDGESDVERYICCCGKEGDYEEGKRLRTKKLASEDGEWVDTHDQRTYCAIFDDLRGDECVGQQRPEERGD